MDYFLPTAPLELAAMEKAADLCTPAALAAAARRTDTAPTEAQQAAGNYAKGKVQVAGLTVAIENPKGSTRSGTDKHGKPWSVTMQSHYGYVLGTEGNDGDHVDVFIGPDLASERVYVVNQVDPETGNFDEHKAVLGTASEAAARSLYLSNYAKGWKGLGSIKAMSLARFKTWLAEGDMAKRAALPDAKTGFEASGSTPPAGGGKVDPCSSAKEQFAM